MVRPTLPAIVLAVLAVAGPAAADAGAPTGTAAPTGDQPVEFSIAALRDALLFHAVAASTFAGLDAGLLSDSSFSCPLFSWTRPGPNTPINEVIDPDPQGCWRDVIYRQVPPATTDSVDGRDATAAGLSVMAPPADPVGTPRIG